MTKPFLTRPILLQSLLGALVLAAPPLFSPAVAGERVNLRPVPAQAESAQDARVIVKFRSTSRALAMSAQPAASGAAATGPRRAQALGQRLGMTLNDGAAISDDTQVVFATGVDSQTLIQRLKTDSDVEFAVVDRRRHPHAVSDPLFAAVAAGRSPASGQWYLRTPASPTLASINAEGAWALTTGLPTMVVADLDSGVRPNHPDLVGKLLPGYDFISEVLTANDGDKRDSDPSDPGDWLTQNEVNTISTFAPPACSASDSSWHGTQTAGLIGASTNNGLGMAGVGYQVKVLPVRVLGKCGGYDSDIIAGMRWAAGLSVTGVPANPNPARVVSMSLGYPGNCTGSEGALYTQAISDLRKVGVVVVVSAGNDSQAVNMPGNCAGVITVGGLRHTGTKNGYSSLGPEVTVSAPAGNCVNVNAGEECLYPILSTSDSGTTSPASATYTTGGNDAGTGTSFAAPQVSGTIALMLSVKPSLTPDAVASLLKSSARVFPTTGAGNGVPMCTPPTTSNPALQEECYCTTSTCGGGMLDAGNAVRAAQNWTAPTTSGGTDTGTGTGTGTGTPSDSGGGALGLEWLAGLALAIAALTLPRRRS